MKPVAPIDCASGFDPFTDRGPTFEAHLHACPACADVVRVLSRATFVWKDASAGDAARGVFRERRLASGRGRAPARTTVVTAVLFLAIGVTSAWGLGRLPLPWRAQPAAESPQPLPTPQPPVASAALPTPEARAPDREERTLAPTAPASAAPVAPARPVAATSASELWKLGIARLEQGDRPAAARLFQRVMDAADVDPELRDRATFRLAQVRLAMGDMVTPRDALRRLVSGRDRALGFDAALLLERCVPDDCVSVWDAFLAVPTDEPLRSQALARRAAATESQGGAPSR